MKEENILKEIGNFVIALLVLVLIIVFIYKGVEANKAEQQREKIVNTTEYGIFSIKEVKYQGHVYICISEEGKYGISVVHLESCPCKSQK